MGLGFRRFAWIGAAVLLLGGIWFGLGFVSWPVAGLLNRVCLGLEARSGWTLEVDRAIWVPWRKLEMTDVRFSSPQGGRLHLVKLQVHPQWGSLLQGALTTRWDLSDVRIDPGSWGIHKPLAQEVLSAGPVWTDGSAVLKIRWGQVTLKALHLEGPLLRVQAEGWLTRQSQAHLMLEGALGREFLEEMNWLRPIDSTESLRRWEPFQLKLHGPLRHPDISFASSFFSISLKGQGEL